jgi:hypothetical protein
VSGAYLQCGRQFRHLELDGSFVPFSRGCSFYRVNEAGKIVWARDCVEASPPKPGDATIGLLAVLLPVLRTVGVAKTNPAQLTEVPFEAAAAWLFYAGLVPASLCCRFDSHFVVHTTMHALHI